MQLQITGTNILQYTMHTLHSHNHFTNWSINGPCFTSRPKASVSRWLAIVCSRNSTIEILVNIKLSSRVWFTFRVCHVFSSHFKNSRGNARQRSESAVRLGQLRADAAFGVRIITVNHHYLRTIHAIRLDRHLRRPPGRLLPRITYALLHSAVAMITVRTNAVCSPCGVKSDFNLMSRMPCNSSLRGTLSWLSMSVWCADISTGLTSST